MKSNYPLIDKVRAPCAQTIELAFTNRPAKRSQMLFLLEIPTKLAVPPLYSPVRTHCMQYLQGSNKRDGGSNRNLNGEPAKETMLSEMRVSR